MGAKTLMSVAEFDRLEEPDELSYEFDEGELVVMTKPRPLHNRIVLNLTFELQSYLKAHPVGEVFNPDNLFVLAPNTKRAPDVSFVLAERAKQIDPTADIPGAPDLAVEVLSPTDTVSAMRRKIRQYFNAGAKMVWMVYPETREVEVWKGPSRAERILQDAELLEAPDLLPGFSLRVGVLFG
ncbi:MAG TPA: Uma2 family endonuclease [Bryobacteraceae bacterium]|nr:Uma2 family endonuclease [Bryobacteraceae bacterium]